MISLTFTVDNLTSVLQVFNTIQIRRYIGAGTPNTEVTDLVALSEYTTVSGHDVVNGRNGVSDVLLRPDFSQYYLTDYNGESEDWYISRYYNSTTDSYSGWSAPILGEPGDLYYDPVFPPEIEYGSADKLIIDRIRLLIGDPIGLRREYGEDALSSIHSDGKVYQLDEKGWPAFVTMGGKSFTSTTNPNVNGYMFLKFTEFIDEVCTTCSGMINLCGVEIEKEIINGVDIWYYTFLKSNREIMEVYDSCPIPAGLNITNVTTEAYILQSSIDLVRAQLLNDAIEDGASISDEGSKYNPEGGLKIRKELLDNLEDKLKDVVKSLILLGISGVLLD